MDLSALAQMAPVLAAGFTKNPNTVMNTINMTNQGREAKYQKNLRDFGRELFSTGQIPDAQAVIMAANKHNVRPEDAMGVMNYFVDHLRKKQQMKQADQTYQRGELDLTQTQRTMDRQQAQQELLGQYDKMDKQNFFTEAVKRGLVKPSPYGEMQGELRPGTAYAMDWEKGLPAILQQGPMPQQARTRLPGEELSVIPGQGVYDKANRAWVEKFPQGPAGYGGGSQTGQMTINQAQDALSTAIYDPDQFKTAQMELLSLVTQGIPTNIAVLEIMKKYASQNAPGAAGGNLGQDILSRFGPKAQSGQGAPQQDQGGKKTMRYSRSKGWY